MLGTSGGQSGLKIFALELKNIWTQEHSLGVGGAEHRLERGHGAHHLRHLAPAQEAESGQSRGRGSSEEEKNICCIRKILSAMRWSPAGGRLRLVGDGGDEQRPEPIRSQYRS